MVLMEQMKLMGQMELMVLMDPGSILNYTVCVEAGLSNIFSNHLTAFWEGHTDADMEVLYSLLYILNNKSILSI